MRIIFLVITFFFSWFVLPLGSPVSVAAEPGTGKAATVVIGDSLSCGPFGRALVSELTKQGQAVTLYCTESSTPEHWLDRKNPPHKKGPKKCQVRRPGEENLALCGGDGKMPDLDVVLSEAHGGRVIIALGANSLGAPHVDFRYLKIAQMAKARGGCDWIGPPHMNMGQNIGYKNKKKGAAPTDVEIRESNLDEFYDSLGEATQGLCRLVDSRNATRSCDSLHKSCEGNQTVDGIHRTESAGKYWARQISAALSGIRGSGVGQGAATAHSADSQK